MKGPPRKPYATITCKHCGKDFEARRFRATGDPKRIGHSSGFRKQSYCSGECRNYARGPGAGHIDRHGYKVLRKKRSEPQRYEHRVVVEREIGRNLLPGETVHHKNGIRNDNRPENLELWSSRHGGGQRVTDRIADAKALLAEHGHHPAFITAADYVGGALAMGG